MSFCALALALLFATPAAPISLQDARWRIAAQESKRETYQGRDALFIHGGTAWLDGVSFQDGIVEFDVAAPEDPGFHGLSFRAQSDGDFEHVYLRPHLSAKPDAAQYQPVFNGNSAWQIYSGPPYSLQATIPHDRWVHVKAAFRGKRLELSVDGETLVFNDLVRSPAAGKIGLTSSAAGGRFANVIVRPDETEPAAGADTTKLPETPAGAVTQWRISIPFEEAQLDRAIPSGLRWDTIGLASRGVANIGTIRKIEDKKNTVFAAVTLRANAATTIRVKFGFSDRVVAYVNGRPVYRGNDRFQTRDYRFLGTAGLFDELVIPLQRGDNKLWFAVSEDFGGWAVAMQLAGAVGVEVVAQE